MHDDLIVSTNYGDLPVPVFTSTSNYPDNWQEISVTIKEKAGWKCVRCGAENNAEINQVLTVHHLIKAKKMPWLTVWWNCVALCQACHLHMEHKRMDQCFMLEHSSWFQPYVAGYYAWRYGGDYSREAIMILLRKFKAMNMEVTENNLRWIWGGGLI